MSFSLEIKDEILSLINNSNCCIETEISALINYIGELSFHQKTQNFTLTFQAENIKILERFNILIKNILHCSFAISQNKSKTYFIKIEDQLLINKILEKFNININNKYTQENLQNLYISPEFLSISCCKRAYLRIAFVCCGYICNPEKNYHIEFIHTDYSQALELKEIMAFFNIDTKIIERKGYFVEYIKEGEQIVDLLNIISAHKSLLKLENIRVLKDVRNNVNRKVNCETANLNKTIFAAVKQKEDIELIKNRLGLESLSKPLKDVAVIRLAFPEFSLKEIAEKLRPPISKSGVNHRFAKINNIAEKLRSNYNDN